ncbi:FtsK/SpoIIIE domain-containing protein [Microbacterium sp. GXF6406]
MMVLLLAFGLFGAPSGLESVAVLGRVLWAVIVLGLALVAMVPALRHRVLGRSKLLAAAFRPGLARASRASLSKFERSALARLRQVNPDWAVAAGVTRDGTTRSGDKVRTFPALVRVELRAHGPAAVYQVVPGTVPSDYDDEKVSAALGFPVECSAASASTVRVQVRSREALADQGTIPFRMVPLTDAAAPVCIGVTSEGPFSLPIFGRQTLLVGASGAGKGSVIWSVLGQLAPSIHAGTVQVHGVDLKGGVELTAGRPLFHDVAYSYDEAAAMIERLARRLDDRLAYMRENGLRKHVPTVAEPLELLLIDEAASLSYLAPDTKSRNAVDANLKRVLSTGRAAGIAVLAAMQDPRKESLASRDLFTATVALRFRTKDDAVLALGSAAYEAGAHCDRIPTTKAGMGYVIDGETGGIVQFQASWVSDEDITELARRYPAPVAVGDE